MSKQVKKTIHKAIALVLVLLLTTGTISVLGMDTGEYQYNNSNIYIATETETGDDNAAETPDDGIDNGYYTDDDSVYDNNYADADYGNDNETDSDYDDTDYDYEDEDYDYTEEDEYDEDEEDDEYGLYGLLTQIIPIMPLSSIIIDEYTILPITIISGETAEIGGDVTGNITVDGGTLVLDENFTITGTITVQNGGTFIMSLGRITGNSRGVIVTGQDSTFTMSGGYIEDNIVVQGSIVGNTMYTSAGVTVTDGAIFNMSGTATIRNNQFSSSIGSSIQGAGVNVNNNATFNMVNGLIENNTINSLGSTSGAGVAVDGNATFDMQGGRIENNRVLSGAGNGAGVAVSRLSSFTMSGDSVIYNNHILGFWGMGGGVIISGAEFEMSGGYIIGNSVPSGWGGGVMLTALAWVLDGVSVNVSSTFDMTGGIIGGENPNHQNIANQGGGVHVNIDSTFNMHYGAEIIGNRAVNGGGVHVTHYSNFYMRGVNINGEVRGGLIYNNTATSNGGGVRIVDNSSFTMEGGIIENNTANQNGGGVAVQSGANFTMSSTALIYDNDAVNGGGVFVTDANSEFTMTGGVIEDNTATQNGGGVFVWSEAHFEMSGSARIYDNTAGAFGGGISGDNGTDVALGAHAPVTLVINGGTIEGNRALNGGGVRLNRHASLLMTGGIIENNTATENGGGVFITTVHADFTMTGGTIEDNTASRRGGGVFVSAGVFTMSGADTLIHLNSVTGNTGSGQSGGGVSIEGVNSKFTMYDGVIADNEAIRQGGGVNIDLGAQMTMYGGSITRNRSHDGPAGVRINRGETDLLPLSRLDMHGGSITHNYAYTGNGGGVGVWNSIFEMSGDSLIAYNSAPHGGGVIATGDTSGEVYNFIMHGGTIRNNVAREAHHDVGSAAGGVRVASAGRFLMEGGNIQDNHALTARGGGVVLRGNVATDATIFTMNGGTISSNTAVDGGGIFVYGNSLMTAIGGTIEDNTATEYGGGIWTALYGNINIADTVIFSGNTANAPHDHGATNRGSSTPIDAIYSGGGQGGNPQNIDWATVSIPGTHALNNFDINYTGAPLFELEVIVRDESGNPITDAEVIIRNEDGDIIFTGTTDEDGRVSIFVPDGEYEVTASHPDYDDVPPVDVVIDGGDETVIIVLPTPTHTVTFLPGGTDVTNMPLNRTVADGTAISTAGGAVTIPVREGYTFLGWLQTIPAATGNISSAYVGNIVVTQDMTFVAQWQPINNNGGGDNGGGDNGGGDNGGGNNNGGGTTPPPLRKDPDSRYVNIGDHINWSLRNIPNYTGETISDFSIVDMPSRGLNFVSGNLPAFTNGAGITFDIRYTVVGSNEWRTYASGVDASQPFSFSLPQPGNIHYTNIGFFFGTVPADFALGNEIVLTFLVTDESPTNILVNRFALRYRNVERQGQGEVIVRPPATGGGDGGGNWLPGTTPQTPGQPGDVNLPSVAQDITDMQQQTVYEQAQTPVVYGYEPPATTDTPADTTDTTSTITGRVNPQTSDNFSLTGIILSMLGIIASLGALLLVGKSRRKNAA